MTASQESSCSALVRKPVGVNFRRLALANVSAQAIPLAVSPILTRLYDPVAFGSFGIFTTVTANAAAIATLKFDWLIPNETSVGRARALLRAGLAATVTTTVIAFLAVLTVPALGSQLPDAMSRALFTIALPCTASIALLSGWWIREGALGVMGFAKLMQAGSTAAVAIALGMVVGPRGHGLEWAFVVGLVLACKLMAVPRTEHRPISEQEPIPSASSVAWGLRHSAAISTGIAMMNVACGSIPIIVASVVFSAEEVGWVVLAQRVILGPPALLSAAFANAFWSNAAVLAREAKFNELSALYRVTTLRLLWISLVPTAACLLAPHLIGPIFGSSQWQAAGDVGQALAPMMLGNVALAPTNHLVVLGAQRLQFLSDGTRLLLSALIGIAASWFDVSLTTTIWLLSFASLIGNAVLFLTHVAAHARAQPRIQLLADAAK
jgi:O-antigen/teichoic acid export membrane protein